MAQKISVFWCKSDPDILLYMEFKYTRPIQKDFQRDDNITKRCGFIALGACIYR